MKVIKGRNVNDLYYQGLDYLLGEGDVSPSRNGEVIVAQTPVTSVYERPRERVLFDANRDANPFFHLFESLWMLAGKSSAMELDFYVRNFGERFAEPDWNIHGAYGSRWRSDFGFDQLDVIVDKLRRNHDDRQCVLQMWDGTVTHHSPIDDVRAVQYGQDDLNGIWKDRPCNTHVYFRVRRVSTIRGGEKTYDDVLDMTICCRSNDAIWGAYGANAVHFSVLQEYVAGRVGVGVGRMYQVSNNFHAYVDVLQKMKLPTHVRAPDRNPYLAFGDPTPIGTDWRAWDGDLEFFMNWHIYVTGLFRNEEPNKRDEALSSDIRLVNKWFSDVAALAAKAYAMYRCDDLAKAIEIADKIDSPDWRIACCEWLTRRQK